MLPIEPEPIVSEPIVPEPMVLEPIVVEPMLPELLASLAGAAEAGPALELTCFIRIQFTASSTFWARLRVTSAKVLIGVGAVLVASAVEWLIWAWDFERNTPPPPFQETA